MLFLKYKDRLRLRFNHLINVIISRKEMNKFNLLYLIDLFFFLKRQYQ